MKLSIQNTKVEANDIRQVGKSKPGVIALTMVSGDKLHIPFVHEKDPIKACNKAVINLITFFKHDKNVKFNLSN